MHTSGMRKALVCLETKEIAAPAYSCLDLTILTWLCVAGWVYLLRLDKQEVSFRLPMPNDDLICTVAGSGGLVISLSEYNEVFSGKVGGRRLRLEDPT